MTQFVNADEVFQRLTAERTRRAAERPAMQCWQWCVPKPTRRPDPLLQCSPSTGGVPCAGPNATPSCRFRPPKETNNDGYRSVALLFGKSRGLFR